MLQTALEDVVENTNKQEDIQIDCTRARGMERRKNNRRERQEK